MGSYGIRAVLCVTGLCLVATANADGEEIPDMAFLEYLGMWDETDEDWLLLEDEAPAEGEEQHEPKADSDDAAENSDED